MGLQHRIAPLVGITLLVLPLLFPTPALSADWTEDDAHVVPGPIDADSVRMSGLWNRFNVSWTGPSGGRNRSVYYRVEINHSDRHSSLVSTQASFYYMLVFNDCTMYNCVIAATFTGPSILLGAIHVLRNTFFLEI